MIGAAEDVFDAWDTLKSVGNRIAGYFPDDWSQTVSEYEAPGTQIGKSINHGTRIQQSAVPVMNGMTGTRLTVQWRLGMYGQPASSTARALTNAAIPNIFISNFGSLNNSIGWVLNPGNETYLVTATDASSTNACTLLPMTAGVSGLASLCRQYAKFRIRFLATTCVSRAPTTDSGICCSAYVSDVGQILRFASNDTGSDTFYQTSSISNSHSNSCWAGDTNIHIDELETKIDYQDLKDTMIGVKADTTFQGPYNDWETWNQGIVAMAQDMGANTVTSRKVTGYCFARMVIDLYDLDIATPYDASLREPVPPADCEPCGTFVFQAGKGLVSHPKWDTNVAKVLAAPICDSREELVVIEEHKSLPKRVVSVTKT